MDSEDDLHYSTDVESVDDDCDFYSGEMDIGMGYYSDDDDPDAEDFVDDDTDDYFRVPPTRGWFSQFFLPSLIFICSYGKLGKLTGG